MNHNEARQELFRFQYNGQFQQCNDYPVGVSSGGPFYPVEPETPTSFGGIDFNCMDFALRVEKNYHQIRDVVCKAEIVDGKLKYSAAELNQKVNSLVTSEIPTLSISAIDSHNLHRVYFFPRVKFVSYDNIMLARTPDFHWATSMAEEGRWGEKQGICGDLVIWNNSEDLVYSIQRRRDQFGVVKYPYGPYLFYRKDA